MARTLTDEERAGTIEDKSGLGSAGGFANQNNIPKAIPPMITAPIPGAVDDRAAKTRELAQQRTPMSLDDQVKAGEISPWQRTVYNAADKVAGAAHDTVWGGIKRAGTALGATTAAIGDSIANAASKLVAMPEAERASRAAARQGWVDKNMSAFDRVWNKPSPVAPAGAAAATVPAATNPSIPAASTAAPVLAATPREVPPAAANPIAISPAARGRNLVSAVKPKTTPVMAKMGKSDIQIGSVPDLDQVDTSGLVGNYVVAERPKSVVTTDTAEARPVAITQPIRTPGAAVDRTPEQAMAYLKATRPPIKVAQPTAYDRLMEYEKRVGLSS